MHQCGPNPDVEAPAWLDDVQQQLGAQLLTTHISWVLLTEDLAYKFKRPLRLPFLDYSTPQLRLACCQRELELNRRYAPEVYLDIELLGPTNEPAVVMQRFEQSQRADHLVASGGFGVDDVAELVTRVLALHRAAPTPEPDSALGTPESTWRWTEGALRGLSAQLGADPQLAALADWSDAEFHRLAPLMSQRKQQGWVREGHGDLHLQNVVSFNGHVLPYDCIEFNAELRWLDIANELSFTYFDLLGARRPDLAATLANEWFTETADATGLTLLAFYAVKGALVRAMVAGDEYNAATRKKYLDVATSLATEPTPTLTITHGVSGSGKSTQARALAMGDPNARTIWLRSDVERKRLHGMSPLQPSGSTADAGIYTATDTEATYTRLVELATDLLGAGWSVVVDAAFLQRWQRDQLRAVAAKAGVAFAIVECTAEPAELRRRIQQRKSDPSEATVAVLEAQLANYAPLDPDERGHVITAGG